MSKTAAQRQKEYRERRKQKEGPNYFKSECSRVRKYYVKTNSLSECQKRTRRKKTRDYVRNHRRATRACRDVSIKTESKVVPDDSNMLPDDSNMVPDTSNMVPDNSKMVPDNSNMLCIKSTPTHAQRQKAYRERKKQKEGAHYLKCESSRVRKYYVKTDSLSECQKHIRRKKNQEYVRTYLKRCAAAKACRDATSNMVPENTRSRSFDVSTAMLHMKSPTSHALRQKAYRERKKQQEGSNFLKCECSRVKKYYKKMDSLSAYEKRIRREKNREHVRSYLQRQRAAKACREGYVVPAYPNSNSSDVTAMVVELPGIAPCRHSKRRERTSRRISEAHVIDDVNDDKLSLLRLVESVGTMEEQLVCTTEKCVYVPSSIATAEVEEGTHVYKQEEPDPANYEDFPVLPDHVNNVCHAECFNGLVKMEVFNEEHDLENQCVICEEKGEF